MANETQAQVQVNLIGCIQSAIKAKCPIVGIPIPGQRPFTVRRDKLVGALRGMQIIDAAIQLPLDHGHAQMVVYGVAPRVRGTYKFYLANGHQASELMRDWTRAQRKARAHPKPLEPQGKHAKAIARLEKQLAKMGTPRPPHCALLYECKYSDQASKHWRDSGVQWAKWKREARLRNQLWHLANKTKPQMTTTQLYKAARNLKVGVRTWSDVPERERERKHITTLFDYLKRFHEFCGLTEKPSCFEPQEWYVKSADGDYADFGPDHYASWLDEVRARKELESQIAGIREMMQP
jgi:hypothetical protein